jgi:hypothetical protein
MYFCSYLGVYYLLSHTQCTPDRWAKFYLYLFINSDELGFGHVSKVPVKSFSGDLSNA